MMAVHSTTVNELYKEPLTQADLQVLGTLLM